MGIFNMIRNNLHASSQLLQTSVKGMQNSEIAFSKAAEKLITAYVNATNKVTSNTTENINIAAESFAVLDNSADINTPLITMAYAKNAYIASAKVMQAEQNLLKTTRDIMA